MDTIIKHYEACLEKYGDSHLGVDWPKAGDTGKRYRVMLDIIKFAGDVSDSISLLDFGCGAAHLYKYILDQGIENINYTGLDKMDEMAGIDVSKEGWDSTMITYPFVLAYKEKKYLFYNGNGFGRTGIGYAEWKD